VAPAFGLVAALAVLAGAAFFGQAQVVLSPQARPVAVAIDWPTASGIVMKAIAADRIGPDGVVVAAASMVRSISALVARVVAAAAFRVVVAHPGPDLVAGTIEPAAVLARMSVRPTALATLSASPGLRSGVTAAHIVVAAPRLARAVWTVPILAIRFVGAMSAQRRPAVRIIGGTPAGGVALAAAIQLPEGAGFAPGISRALPLRPFAVGPFAIRALAVRHVAPTVAVVLSPPIVHVPAPIATPPEGGSGSDNRLRPPPVPRFSPSNGASGVAFAVSLVSRGRPSRCGTERKATACSNSDAI
jgi:hypothetical protein